MFADPSSNKSNIFERDWSNFEQENSVLDYFDIGQPNILNFDEKMLSQHLATNNFLAAINFVLNKYAPFKKVNKYKLRLKSKKLR